MVEKLVNYQIGIFGVSLKKLMAECLRFLCNFNKFFALFNHHSHIFLTHPNGIINTLISLCSFILSIYSDNGEIQVEQFPI